MTGSMRSDTAAWRRHCTDVPAHVIEAVRAGSNDACVDCGDTPVAGGLRCFRHFSAVAQPPKRHRLGGNPEPALPYVALGGRG